MIRLPSVALLGLALLSGCLLSGCSDDGRDGASTADCTTQVRVDGTTYTEHGFTDARGTKWQEAEVAECHDNGVLDEKPEGSVFTGDGRRVHTRSFPGQAPERVLGLRADERTLAVFFSDEVPDAERDRILKQLDRQ